MVNPLCCCEYIDEEGERSHLLGCCCNCVAVDLLFDRLITCRRIPKELLCKIMATTNDRMRVPWRGGAKRISVDIIMPIIILPTCIFTAAQGVWISVVTFTFLPLFLMYIYFIYTSCNPHSPFFFTWTITSILMTVVIFEFFGINLLEIRIDENLAFSSLTVGMVFCLYKVKQKALLCHVTDDTTLAGKMSASCVICNIKVPARTYHCHVCHVCILKRDQHCFWLNCCIGERNHRWYMALLVSSLCQGILCSNLILTTACHPFTVWGSIMLPDDCTDVYYDSMYAICFVTALYCLVSCAFITSLLIHETWLISLGVTGDEWRNRGKCSRCCGLFSSRPHSKGFFQNWIRYCRGADVSVLPHEI